MNAATEGNPNDTGASAARPSARPATPNEASLSGILIGGAFGLIAGAVFAVSSFLDKVEGRALLVGFGLAVVASLFLLASIIAGGRGMSRPLTPGQKNPFNVQAGTGLVGVLLLCVAAAVFLLNAGSESDRLETQIKTIEDKVGRLQSDVAHLQNAVADTLPRCPSRATSANLKSVRCEAEN